MERKMNSIISNGKLWDLEKFMDNQEGDLSYLENVANDTEGDIGEL